MRGKKHHYQSLRVILQVLITTLSMSQGAFFLIVNFCDCNFSFIHKIYFNIPNMVSEG